MVGDKGKAVELSRRLYALGYYVTALRYPSVPRDKARLRILFMATHTDLELERLVNALKHFGMDCR